MRESIKTRQSNIELLRILSMLGVILLHINNTGIGKAFLYVEPKSINYYILYFLEASCIVAVNLFILISGYFMCNSYKRDLFKPARLLIQVIIFASISYAVKICFFNEAFSIKRLIRCFIPNNYFVILYIALYFISIYYNIVIERLSKKQLQIMVLLLFTIFSVWNSAVDILGELSGSEWLGLSTVGMYGSQEGYTIVQFSLMYFIGGYIRKYGINVKFNEFFILINTFIIAFWATLNKKTGLEYCNPVIIVNAVLIFNVFRKINIGSHKFINVPAKSAFSVFLLHGLFLSVIDTSKIVVLNPIIMILFILSCAILIYAACFVIDVLYNYTIGKLIDVVQSKLKLPVISLKEK